jgi:two-component system, LytTR family, sensor kinase
MSGSRKTSEMHPSSGGFALLAYFSHVANGRIDPSSGLFQQYIRTTAACVLPWALICCVGFVQDLSRRLYWDDLTPLQDAWFWGVRILLWAAMTPFILWLGARWPIDGRRRIALHLSFAVVFAFARASVELAIQYPLNKWGVIGPTEWLEDLNNAIANMLIFGLHGSFFTYWVVLSVQATFRYYEKFRDREQEAVRLALRASQLTAQVARARLGALKMQLQPHFLFNTLNAIVVLVRQNKAGQAEEALTRFSDLLRAVLDDMDAQEVPLSKELDYLKLYLAVEQMRFSDRLQVDILADLDVLDAAVPHMGLQPIVENAVRHGLGQQANGGVIQIQVQRLDQSLHISVRDDGPGVANACGVAGRGMGLSNLRARLQQLYGEQAQLRIESAHPRGAVVKIVLPYRRHSGTENQIVSGDLQDDFELEPDALECAGR